MTEYRNRKLPIPQEKIDEYEAKTSNVFDAVTIDAFVKAELKTDASGRYPRTLSDEQIADACIKCMEKEIFITENL